MTDQQLFSDGVGQITVIGGAVRLDFVTYSATEKDAKGQPAAVFAQRVIMSLDGFMNSAAKIQEAAQAITKLAQQSREKPSVASAMPVNVAAESVPPKQLFP
ncbi:MAG TPA: hypothetical protein VJS47_05720 [Rhizomicrobium sp.]|nr:hypothetical protein [Rhizomicrobium sp.]